MGRRIRSRRRRRGLFGTAGEVFYKSVGMKPSDQKDFEDYMRLCYAAVAAICAVLAVIAFLGSTLGGAGTLIACFIAGSWAFVATAERVQRPLL